MSNVLIVADHEGGKVAKTAAELATIGKRIGTVVAAVLASNSQADAVAAQLASTDVEKVLAVESDDFAKHGIPALVDALAQIATQQPFAKAERLAGSAQHHPGHDDPEVGHGQRQAVTDPRREPDARANAQYSLVGVMHLVPQ